MQEFHLETIGPSGDCTVLQVAGEVDVYTAPALRERIQDLAAKGAVHVIADLSRVDFLDSTGLGVLVGGLRRLREHDGSLTLVISAPRILRVFEMTGLTKVFPPQPGVWPRSPRTRTGGRRSRAKPEARGVVPAARPLACYRGRARRHPVERDGQPRAMARGWPSRSWPGSHCVFPDAVQELAATWVSAAATWAWPPVMRMAMR